MPNEPTLITKGKPPTVTLNPRKKGQITFSKQVYEWLTQIAGREVKAIQYLKGRGRSFYIVPLPEKHKWVRGTYNIWNQHRRGIVTTFPAAMKRAFKLTDSDESLKGQASLDRVPFRGKWIKVVRVDLPDIVSTS